MSSTPPEDSTPFDDADTGEIDDLGMTTEQGPADGEETSDQIDTGGQQWPSEEGSADNDWEQAGDGEYAEGDYEDGYDDEYEPYVPPDTLPPPYASSGGLPVFAVLLSLIVAVALGAAMVASTWFLYIPLVYSVLAGVCIGWAVGKAPKWSNFTSSFLLFLLTLLCTLIVYVISHAGVYLVKAYGLDNYTHFFGQPWQEQSEELLTYMQGRGVRMQAFGQPLGLYGAIGAWASEVLITLAIAWLFVRPSIRLYIAESVPAEVLEMVLNLQSEGFTAGGVRDELKLRGWSRGSDQAKALRAAAAYDKLVGNR